MKVNGREVSNKIAILSVIAFVVLFIAVAVFLVTWDPRSPDGRRIDAMLEDGTWTRHIRDGRYYGHYSCDWGLSTTVAVEVKGGRIEAIEVVAKGHSDNPKAEAFREEVLRTQVPPLGFSDDRAVCEMHGAIRNALAGADYDTRTAPYHPVAKDPPRGP